MAQSDPSPAEVAPQPPAEEIAALLDRLGVGRAPGRVAGAPQRGGESNLIGVLQDVQEHFGYLSPEALEQISLRMRIPLSRVYGVVSFYAQFYTEPHGRHTIRCCRGTACHVRGGRRVLETVRQTLSIDEGQTTEDMEFYLETVACLGTCFLAPAMMIDDRYYGKLVPQRVKEILDDYRARKS